MFLSPFLTVNLLCLSAVLSLFLLKSSYLFQVVNNSCLYACTVHAHASEHAEPSNLLKMRQVTASSSYDFTMSPCGSESNLKWLLLCFLKSHINPPSNLKYQQKSSLPAPVSSLLLALYAHVVFNSAQYSGKCGRKSKWVCLGGALLTREWVKQETGLPVSIQVLKPQQELMASYPLKSGDLSIFLSSDQVSHGILSFGRCHSVICAVRLGFCGLIYTWLLIQALVT